MGKQVPKTISQRTKEGDTVFDGGDVYSVLHRIGLALVLKPVYGNDWHYYVRNIEGGTRRFSDYQDALNHAALPCVVAGVMQSRAEQGHLA